MIITLKISNHTIASSTKEVGFNRDDLRKGVDGTEENDDAEFRRFFRVVVVVVVGVVVVGVVVVGDPTSRTMSGDARCRNGPFVKSF